MTVTRVARPMTAKTTRATVLFADLRGYTGLAERLAPARIVPLLDEFFGLLAGATARYEGRVFHMAGDGMMAGFGVHDAVHGGARQALAAGHTMLQEFAAVADRWRRELSIEAGIGVGLHLGEVALGSARAAGAQAHHSGRRYRQRRRAALQSGARRRGAVILHRGGSARGRRSRGWT